jgi:hypothetical protein
MGTGCSTQGMWCGWGSEGTAAAFAGVAQELAAQGRALTLRGAGIGIPAR